MKKKRKKKRGLRRVCLIGYLTQTDVRQNFSSCRARYFFFLWILPFIYIFIFYAIQAIQF